ncbi:MAG: flippase [Candidatus Nanoarchaeia archaeon]
MVMKKALRGAILVFIYSIIGLIFAYLFRIMLTRNLTVYEYGLFYAIFAFFSSLTIFTDLGFSQAVLKYVVDFRVKRNKEAIKGVLLYSLLLQLLLSFIILVIILLFRNSLSADFFTSNEPIYLVLMGFWFLTLPLQTFLVSLFLGFEKSGTGGSLDMFRQIGAFALASLFLFLHFGEKSPFFAYACLNILTLLVYIPFIKKTFPDFFKVRARFTFKQIVSLIKYGSYIVFASITGIILTQTDSLLLTYFKGVEAVGLYQSAVPLANMIIYISAAITTVSFPLVSRLYAQKKKKEIVDGIKIIYKYCFFLGIPFAIIIFAYSDLILSLMFGPQYAVASLALKILTITALFNLITSINNSLIIATGFPKEIAKNMLYVAVLNLILCIILIPPYGIVGAAIATAISFFFALILSTYRLRKIIKIKVPIWSWIINILIGVAVLFVINFLRKAINTNWIIEAGIILVAAGVIYLALALLFKIIDVKEIKNYVEMVLK